MGRGKSPHTVIKEAITKGSTVEAAIEIGKLKAYQHMEKLKPWEVSLREHIGKMIDRVDPLQVAAVLATTFAIKQGVNWIDYWVNVGQKQPWRLSAEIIKRLGSLIPFSSALTFLDQIPIALEQGDKSADQEVFEWCISFALAYIVIVHGLDIGKGLIPFVMGVIGL